MKHLMRLSLTSLMCMMATVTSVRAMMIAPQPVPLRVAIADAVVIGKVTGFGAKLEQAEMFKGDMRQMQVATVKVEETFAGKGRKEIKVGFFPPPPPPPVVPGRVRPFIKRRGSVQLTLGQEAALFLTKHPTKDLYVVQAFSDAIDKKSPNFAADRNQIEKAAKLLANSSTGLKSKDADERFMTAALLIARYRTMKPGSKLEPISAEESKLILTALAKADWAPKPGQRPAAIAPQNLFFRLGLTAKDGWTQPKDYKAVPAEAKKWLEDNAGKFRMQRFAPPKAEASAEPGK